MKTTHDKSSLLNLLGVRRYEAEFALSERGQHAVRWSWISAASLGSRSKNKFLRVSSNLHRFCIWFARVTDCDTLDGLSVLCWCTGKFGWRIRSSFKCLLRGSAIFIRPFARRNTRKPLDKKFKCTPPKKLKPLLKKLEITWMILAIWQWKPVCEIWSAEVQAEKISIAVLAFRQLDYTGRKYWQHCWGL